MENHQYIKKYPVFRGPITIRPQYMPGETVYVIDDPLKIAIEIEVILIKKGGLYVYLLSNGEEKYSFEITNT